MVHALEEAWRVLVSGGRLVDLRPVASKWPVEVLSDGRSTLAGEIDHMAKISNDIACDEAIAEVTRRELFARESEESFEYGYYWPTIDDTKAYIHESFTSAVLSDSTIAKARRLVRLHSTQVELRARRKMFIAVHRRLGE